MTGRRLWQMLMIVFAVAAGTLGSSPKPLKGLENAMRESSQKIEGLVERVSRVKPTVNEVARALGTKTAEQEGVTTVRIGIPPFESARVSQYLEVINFSIGLSAGKWRLSDITDNPLSWSIAPPFPDSGREEAVRDWRWPHVGIRCTAGVEGEEPIEKRTILDVECQVTPH